MGRIALRGIRAYGRHGTLPGERDNPQPFDVDLVVEIDTGSAQLSDDLRDTLDYAALHARVVDVIETTSFGLLERLGRAIVDAALADERVAHAEVIIAKPGILDGATPSVTISRHRRPS